jgi:hypothetical protein
MKKQKSIFLYDPNELNAIFILAAIKKLGFKIWPINTMQSLWTWLIDGYYPVFIISEKNRQNFPDLKTYLWLSKAKIGGFIDPCNIQKKDVNPDIQLVLTKLKKNSMLKNTEDISHPERWEKNPTAFRYGKALRAGKIFLKNKHKPERLIKTIDEAITEINEGKQSYSISLYEENYDYCLYILTEVKTKINTNNSPIKFGNKPIAYGYLDNISPWLDLEKLQKDLVILYPFMTIIQYRLDNKEYTWVGSATINVNLIFSIKNNDKNPHGATLKGPHDKIINLLKAEAKSLSK